MSRLESVHGTSVIDTSTDGTAARSAERVAAEQALSATCREFLAELALDSSHATVTAYARDLQALTTFMLRPAADITKEAIGIAWMPQSANCAETPACAGS